MSTYYKAVRPDGTDFYTGTVQWAPRTVKARKGRTVKHPASSVPVKGDYLTFLSVSTDPTDLPGSSWPMRLLEVEPVGDLIDVSDHKRGGCIFRVLRELDPTLRFGPQGTHVVALIDRAGTLTREEVVRLAAAWDVAWDVAWDAARAAAWDAASALVVRDLIGQHGLTQEYYDTLTGPWRRVIGPIHPEDEEWPA